MLLCAVCCTHCHCQATRLLPEKDEESKLKKTMAQEETAQDNKAEKRSSLSHFCPNKRVVRTFPASNRHSCFTLYFSQHPHQSGCHGPQLSSQQTHTATSTTPTTPQQENLAEFKLPNYHALISHVLPLNFASHVLLHHLHRLIRFSPSPPRTPVQRFSASPSATVRKMANAASRKFFLF